MKIEDVIFALKVRESKIFHICKVGCDQMDKKSGMIVAVMS